MGSKNLQRLSKNIDRGHFNNKFGASISRSDTFQRLLTTQPFYVTSILYVLFY